MSLPHSIFRALGLVSISFSIHSLVLGNTPMAAIQLVWPDNGKSPAICVGKPEWFVGVVPESVDLVDLEVSGTASIEFAGETAAATLLHLDTKSRLCLFESNGISSSLSPVPLAGKEKVIPGAKLHCPTGGGNCASTITGKEWSYRGVNFHSPLLHLRLADANKHCEAGTPLINSNGELEGIVTTYKTTSKNEVFAIPASHICKMIKEFKQHRKSGPVWIGLLFHAESSSPEVMKVKADSPSSAAGIEPGDVVLGVNNQEVDNLNDLVEIIQSLPAEEEATFRLLRDVTEKSVSLTPQFATASPPENE